jgi:hypothetical protein
MNKMTPLEAQLRSWTPRGPSPILEHRLFGPAQNHYPVQRWLTVLAPTAACLLLTVALLRQPGPALAPGDESQAALVALGLSNQSYAAYLPGSFQPTANRLDTFEWTNRGCSTSSMRSFTPPKATDLQ